MLADYNHWAAENQHKIREQEVQSFKELLLNANERIIDFLIQALQLPLQSK